MVSIKTKLKEVKKGKYILLLTNVHIKKPQQNHLVTSLMLPVVVPVALRLVLQDVDVVPWRVGSRGGAERLGRRRRRSRWELVLAGRRAGGEEVLLARWRSG